MLHSFKVNFTWFISLHKCKHCKDMPFVTSPQSEATFINITCRPISAACRECIFVTISVSLSQKSHSDAVCSIIAA